MGLFLFIQYPDVQPKNVSNCPSNKIWTLCYGTRGSLGWKVSPATSPGLFGGWRCRVSEEKTYDIMYEKNVTSIYIFLLIWNYLSLFYIYRLKYFFHHPKQIISEKTVLITPCWLDNSVPRWAVMVVLTDYSMYANEAKTTF